jgi:hypothetical protein
MVWLADSKGQLVDFGGTMWDALIDSLFSSLLRKRAKESL